MWSINYNLNALFLDHNKHIETEHFISSKIEFVQISRSHLKQSGCVNMLEKLSCFTFFSSNLKNKESSLQIGFDPWIDGSRAVSVSTVVYLSTNKIDESLKQFIH